MKKLFTNNFPFSGVSSGIAQGATASYAPPVELPAGLQWDINPGVPSSVTHSSGVVSGVADLSGNNYDLTVTGSGADVLYDASDASLVFQDAKGLICSVAGLRDVFSTTQAKTIIVAYKTDVSDTPNRSILCSAVDTNNRFAMASRSDQLRAAMFNGSFIGRQSVAELTDPETKSFAVYTWDGSSAVNLEVDLKPSTGTDLPSTGGVAAVTVGIRNDGLEPMDGKIYRILAFNRVLSESEIKLITEVINELPITVGVGQSLEELKHSTTSPYAQGGKFSYINTINNSSSRVRSVYLDASIGGSYVSRKAYNASGLTHDNVWVDDTVSPPVADNLLNDLYTLVETTNGIPTDYPVKFIVCNSESEAARLNAGDITEAELKTAQQGLVDLLTARYPNCKIYWQLIGRYNSSFDAAVDSCRDVQLEIIAENDNVYYSHDMANLYLEGGDSVHYSPSAYVTACARQALAINQGIKGATAGTPTVSGAVVTVPYSFGAGGGSAFTNSTFMPFDNLMTDSRDFTTWTVSGCTVTANTTTGVDGIVTIADTIDKTSTGTRSIRKTFSTTAGLHLVSIAAQAGTNSNITILLSGNNAGSFHGRVEYDLINGTATPRNTGTSTLQSSGIVDLGADWYLCWLVADLDTITTPICYLYPDVASGIGTIGNIIVDQIMIAKTDTLIDYADIGAPFFRVFDDGAEATITDITDTGSAFEITLSATPAASSIIDVYGGYGKLDTLQRHTIPVDNSANALPFQMFHKTITA